jgi:hypothetical protein
MIKTLLAPYEVYIWAGLAFLLLCGGVYTVHHLEQIGVHKEQMAEAKLAAAQEIHKQEVEDRANQLNQLSGATLHSALTAPVVAGPIVVRVCPPPARPAGHPLPANGGAKSGGTGGPAPVLAAVADGSGTQGVDIAPDTEALLARADAEIAYWRAYYANCKQQGICK